MRLLGYYTAQEMEVVDIAKIDGEVSCLTVDIERMICCRRGESSLARARVLFMMLHVVRPAW